MPVNNHLLFIDTETSGLPKKWNQPYDALGNWPHAVQVAWLVYSQSGELIKEENFYIRDEAVHIEPSAQKIHGLTKEFLSENGKGKENVLPLLAKDIETYQPMIIGHFLELDFHILSAEFYRDGIKNPLADKKHFCTMLSTKHLVRNPVFNYLRLDDLYSTLFQQPLRQQHDALVDARATAQCFFEMLRKGDITEAKIAAQENLKEPLIKRKRNSNPLAFIIPIIIFVLYLWMHDWNF